MLNYQLILRATVLAMIAAAMTGCDQKRESEYPARPIKVIVPFGAGGGSDTFARLIQHAVESDELLSQPLVIVNVPGAGGTIGSRRVKNARPDGYTLLLLHEGILTAKHSGQAAYGPEAFEAIAGSSNATQVIAVSDSSPFSDLSELMDRTVTEPDSLVFAANVGAPSYFAGLMLEAEREGAKFRYTQSGGGAKRFAALKGGHVDVTSFSIAEYVQFRSSGVRAVALLGNERDASLPELATAREQGFNVVSQNMQFWWAPVGTQQDRLRVVAQAIERAMKSDEVRRRLAEMRMAPTTLTGDALAQELNRRETLIAAVAPAQTYPLPDFPRWAILSLLGCAVLAWIRQLRFSKAQQAKLDWRTLAASGGALVVYVLALQIHVVGFQVATLTFTTFLGVLLSTQQSQKRFPNVAAMASIGCVALVMGLGLHWVFTRVLVVDLP